MGLLDEILGAATGGGASDGDEHAGLINPQTIGAVMGTLKSSGGLSGLAKVFDQKGMGDLMSDWVSTGPNPPMTAQQVHSVFGSDQLGQLAERLGISPAVASTVLAKVLPVVVDKLTPQGQIPQEEHSLLDGALGGLLKQGGLGGLFS
jgi:uncharacterized protein YidB (DUF937 family)